MSRTLNFVSAPGIPSVERDALEKHVKDAIDDPDYVIVVNYEVRWDVIEIDAGDKLLATTESGLPTGDVAALQKKLSDKTTDLIVVNYKAKVHVIRGR